MDALAIFENYKIRCKYDQPTGIWYFSVVDIIRVLLDQHDFQTARKYWNKLKERLGQEGSETVTNCHQLKMMAEDGKIDFKKGQHVQFLHMFKVVDAMCKKRTLPDILNGGLICLEGSKKI